MRSTTSVARAWLLVLMSLLVVLGALASPAHADSVGPGVEAQDGLRVLSGRVVASDGAVLSGSGISVYADGSDTTAQPAVTATVDDQGTYRVLVAPGRYRVRAGIFTGAQERWWPDAPTAAEADVLTVADADVADVDLVLPLEGRIQGRVTDDLGLPIAGAAVRADHLVDGEQYLFGSAVTDVDGGYVITGLRDSTYRVSASASGHQTEYWPAATDSTQSQPVRVSAGTALPTDLALDALGTIGGRVTTTDGTPLEHDSVYIRLYRDDDPPGLTRGAYLAPDGTWSATVEPGSYRVRFRARVRDYNPSYTTPRGYVGEWWDDAPDRASSTPVVVAPRAVVDTVDAALSPAAHLTGTIDSTVGARLDAAYATAYRLADEDDDIDYDRFVAVSSAGVRADGTYDIGRLEAGRYRVVVESGEDHVSGEWYDDAATRSDATGVDATLGGTSTFSGRVTDEDGAPVRYFSVTLDARDTTGGGGVRYDSTDADGRYEFTDLETGSYDLAFDSAPTAYLPEYGLDGASTQDAAEPVVVHHADVTDADVEVSSGAHITGTVTASDGAAPPYYQYPYQPTVHVHQRVDGTWRAVASAFVQYDGTYDVDALRPGTYRVQFLAMGTDVGEWWDDSPDRDGARDVVLVGESTVSGVDATLAPGATMSGRVTARDGSGLGNLRVYVAGRDGWFDYSRPSAVTAADGSWSVAGLATDDYLVAFAGYDRDHLTEYYSDAYEPAAADRVHVVAGTRVTGIDATLTPGARMGGRVTDGRGRPRPALPITLQRRSAEGAWLDLGTLSTRDDGTWSASSLTPGTYRVGFDVAARNGQVPTWYGDAMTAADSTPVTLRDLDDVRGIDMRLLDGGRITGTITGTDGAPGAGVRVVATAVGAGLPRRDGRPWEVSTTTAADGSYAVAGLAEGSYVVRERGTTGYDYDGRYHGGTLDVDDATRVRVGPDDVVSDVDIRRPATAQLSGRLLDPTGAPVAGRIVNLVRSDSDGVIRQPDTDAQGRWSITVAPATWSIYYSGAAYSSGPTYAARWYDGDTGTGAPVAVTVGPGGSAGDLDIHLDEGATFSGTVTSDTGLPVAGLDVGAHPRVRPAFFSSPATRATTDADGRYTVEHVPLGAVDLRFGAGDFTDYGSSTPALRTQWWRGAADRSSATAIVVEDDLTARDGLDVVMTPRTRATTTRATAPPTISGDPTVGGTLTATTGTWTPTPESYRYSWWADGERIVGAGGSTYTLTAAEAGRRIEVRVSGQHPTALATTATSLTTAPVSGGAAPVNRTPPTIQGTPEVGARLRAQDGSWSPTPDALRYTWRADGSTIAGADGPVLRVTRSLADQRISVAITALRRGAASAPATSTATGPVVVPVVANTSRPVVNGVARSGQTLQADPGTWNRSDLRFAYQWWSDGAPVAGATTPLLDLTDGDVGHRLSVTVTATHPDLDPASASSTQTAPVAEQPTTPPTDPDPVPATNLTPPAIGGTPAVGRSLTTSTGTWDPGVTTLSFQWFVDGYAIPGATEPRYTLLPALLGHLMSVQVTGSGAERTPTSVTTAATRPVAAGTFSTRAAPRLSSTRPRAGQRVRVLPGRYSVTPTRSTTTWFVAGRRVAVGTAYVPRRRDAGRSLTARVTTSAAGYTTRTETLRPAARIRR